MAEKQTRRLTPNRLVSNTNAFAALKDIPGYQSVSPSYEMNTGNILANMMKETQDKEAQAAAAYKAARDNAVTAEWAMHDFILGAKDQIAAQFGKNSNEFQAMGMKKKKEYKRPSRKPKKA